jgi:ankyrin repeat protein
MLDLGEPFISLKYFYLDDSGTERAPLIELAKCCGLYYADTFHIIDKAILLLSRNADISCRDDNGDTVLHTLLRCRRLHEHVSYAEAVKQGQQLRWTLSVGNHVTILQLV